MKRLLLAIAVAASAAASASASDWVPVYEKNGDTAYVDKSSIVQLEKHVRSWMKINRGRATTLRLPGLGSKPITFRSQLVLFVYDCGRRESEATTMEYYSQHDIVGQVGRSAEDSGYKAVNLSPVTPDSLQEAGLEKSCKLAAGQKGFTSSATSAAQVETAKQ